ncbi:MAG: zinc-dependent metalloprotease [Ignavibacteria bacterium]|nr:zinc-dependent metalloprotease [Ignavibacteria bacterium]
MRLFLFSLLILTAVSTHAESISDKTGSMEKRDGFLPVYWENSTGNLYLEIDRWDSEILYINSLATGIGSNDIGLDRGQLGRGHIVLFRRIGPNVMLVQPNYDYRAVTQNMEERRSVEEAFAQSVLWGFTVVAEEGTRVLVDATDFFLRDAHNVIGTLKRTDQGSYSLEKSRSTLLPEHIKNFPLNLEVEAMLTFTGSDPGNWVRQVVPTPGAITVRQHHSFVQLPEAGYTPRAFDPRSGFIPISYQDYATPITEPLVKRYITRHRLEKKDPGAEVSDAVKPIVYYLDRGAPEPVRSALLDGARWWNQAFEAAGYRDAFRVEMLPEDADPLDLRYNVIQWVHRATRGWSYGSFIEDPRTGEILKGHVSLGSLRVRQDFLIAEGLVADYADGKETDPAMLEMALARIRQLSAHEIGHTIGLMHNFIASTVDRASVMDYPHPYVTLRNDSTFDLSKAYATGIGEWDKVSIAYGYQDFPDGVDERSALDRILMDAAARGLIFLSDQDTRPTGSAHPKAHLWDNGADAVEELNRIMAVRRVALANFSERRIRPGTSLAMLEDVLVPVYLAHRYQVEAAVKVVGGMSYTYAARGDGQNPTTMVPPDEQRRALQAVLATLDPAALAIPERILALIPPRPAGLPSGREHFRGRTSMVLDPVAAAEASAWHTVSLLLDPARAARLVGFHSRSANSPGLDEVIGALLRQTWYDERPRGYLAEIGRSIDVSTLYGLLSLAANEAAGPQVRGIVLLQLTKLQSWLSDRAGSIDDPDQHAHYLFALSTIAAFERSPSEVRLPKPPDLPDGSPIGMWGCDTGL